MTNNVAGGKDPCGSQRAEEHAREGMVERPNHPFQRPLVAKVRELQEALGEAAKRSPGRRFHALYDRIYRSDVLWEAWKRVRSNRGSSGVDRMTLGEIEQRGVEHFLEELHHELRAETYRPQAVLRQDIPKSDGGTRPLGIPAVRDRVVQMATKLVLEEIFEADFRPSSYGYRPKRSATQALETLRRRAAGGGGDHVLDADIRNFFGSLDHGLLMERVRRRISDHRVLRLLRLWLEAGVMNGKEHVEMLSGVPQGGVISPLLSNIYLHTLDAVWERRCAHLGVLVRYADDFVVMCETKEDVEEAERRVKRILSKLKLELHPDKTRKVELTEGAGGFDFLGCHLHKRVSGRLLERGIRRYYLHRWPSTRSMKRVRERVKKLTGRNRNGVKDVRVILADLNPVLRGWGNYFRTGNAAAKFNQVDEYVWRRLLGFQKKRKGRHLRVGDVRRWSQDFFWSLGLHKLRGTIKYPEAA